MRHGALEHVCFRNLAPTVMVLVLTHDALWQLLYRMCLIDCRFVSAFVTRMKSLHARGTAIRGTPDASVRIGRYLLSHRKTAFGSLAKERSRALRMEAMRRGGSDQSFRKDRAHL